MTIYKDAFESKLQRVLALNEEIAEHIEDDEVYDQEILSH